MFLLQVRLNYHSQSATMKPGPLDLFVQYVNDTSGDNSYAPHYQLTTAHPMEANEQGWQRWEAPLPAMPQLRSVAFLLSRTEVMNSLPLSACSSSSSP